jgi:hypothetical protein
LEQSGRPQATSLPLHAVFNATTVGGTDDCGVVDSHVSTDQTLVGTHVAGAESYNRTGGKHATDGSRLFRTADFARLRSGNLSTAAGAFAVIRSLTLCSHHDGFLDCQRQWITRPHRVRVGFTRQRAWRNFSPRHSPRTVGTSAGQTLSSVGQESSIAVDMKGACNQTDGTRWIRRWRK